MKQTTKVPTIEEMRQAALSYAAEGLRVFPLEPGLKKPKWGGWQEDATTDPETIKRWWSGPDLYNVGILTGPESRLYVIDFDHHDNKRGLEVLNIFRSALPETCTARSANGGVHLYYRMDSPLKGHVGMYGKYTSNGEGCVDTRGAGNLIVAPPSVFKGKRYTWETGKAPGEIPITEATDSVLNFINTGAEELGRGKEKKPFILPEKIPEHFRTQTLIALIGSLRAKGLSPEAIRATVEVENELRCDPPLTAEELEREVFPAITRDTWEVNTAPYAKDLVFSPNMYDRIKTLDPVSNKNYGPNDAGNARLFMDLCGDSVKYVSDRRRWYAYDGARWSDEGENIVREKLKEVANCLCMYALNSIPDETKRVEYLKHYGKWQQLRTRETILKDASSIAPAKSSDFDRDPYLLNCLNGTLDLKRYQLRPHNAEDYISKLANVSYDPAAKCPRWEQFMYEVTDGDKPLADYIQQALGYSLTGDTRQECFFILYGASSRNGKSTLTETFSSMLGDYAATARPESIAKKKFANASGPTEDVARLAGARFVNMPEPDKSMELNASQLKSWTGRDTITARRLNEGSFEFIPTFKLFLNSNHRPRVDDLTLFASDRVKMIPFRVHFGEDRRDPYLKDKLTTPESLSGVLNWSITGLAKMQMLLDLKAPEAVRAATEEYRKKEDKLSGFLEEYVETGSDYETPLTEMHRQFGIWCELSGIIPVGIPKFREMLEAHQIVIKRKRPRDKSSKNPLNMVLGVKLAPKN